MTPPLPKAELHCHLEGTPSPSLVRRLARRNRIPLPENLLDDGDNFIWIDVESFLKTYDQASSVIRTAEDYRDLTYDYLASSAKEGALYVEVMSSPDHAAAAGIDYEGHLEGIVEGIESAERDHGIIGRIIVTCVRHFGPEQAMRVAEAVVHSPHPYVVGFGMGGNELLYTLREFAPAFSLIDTAGLPTTVHAGEWAGAESVADALDALPVSRIGHGVRAVEDPALVERLVREGIHLEVCLSSNIATRVYDDFASHPFNQLREAGLSLSLNSDDPPYFATSIGREYLIGSKFFGLDVEALKLITIEALKYSFANHQTKKELITRVV
ncbi:MAG: adenosine deaminase [Arenicellales bacterium]|jgi:adenosine deaminase|nr:adenosine deaminase [Arenicellales bacterium]|tara:strand:- start:1090 stop:2067 length:978 start_codon:yes stop_codon:yes gene_type:complete